MGPHGPAWATWGRMGPHGPHGPAWAHGPHGLTWAHMGQHAPLRHFRRARMNRSYMVNHLSTEGRSKGTQMDWLDGRMHFHASPACESKLKPQKDG
jgi:hypothetical protein